MTTAAAPIAVVATNLAQTDRRAISQAWYSALHIAEHPHSAPPPRSRSALAAPPAGGTPARDHGARAQRAVPAARPVTPRGSAQAAGTPAASLDRRRPATELARRIERAVERAAQRPQPLAALTIRAGDGRVQLLVRNDGGQTRIVAVCAETVRERVERALAHARFTLAGAPVIVETH